ncbi:MAG TPA: HAMP domain-containing sensor histidine kinase [Actinoplanes sp.]|nr:HAMP domain-containing sensor histidine kinase [Actinoplanes sp.]
MTPAGLADRWLRLSLRSRLSLIAAAAVALAVVAVAGLCWAVVRAEVYRQFEVELTDDARVIAQEPDEWGPMRPPMPGRPAPRGEGMHGFGRHEVGPRWQFLDADGTASAGADLLPVTDAARRVATGESAQARETIVIGSGRYLMVTTPVAGGGAVQVAMARGSVDRTLGLLALVLGMTCIGGVVIAALAGRQVARVGLLPVERLTSAVEHVAETKDLQAAIPVRGDDEIARLAGSVNAMLDALGRARAAQRALVEDAGHELRTPLTSLRTNIELLAHTENATGPGLSADDRATLMRDLQTQVVELTQLTDELVALARDDVAPQPVQAVDLTEVVANAVERARLRFPAVPFDVQLTPVTVLGRSGALARMVLNLLDNAAKWSPPGSPVEVRLTRRPGADGTAELTVADAGPGIDEVDRPRVFERFYRALTARSMPGSGLGLAIVAQAVQLHHGSVTVGRSAAGGALLTVTVPIGDLASAPEFSSDS